MNEHNVSPMNRHSTNATLSSARSYRVVGLKVERLLHESKEEARQSTHIATRRASLSYLSAGKRLQPMEQRSTYEQQQQREVSEEVSHQQHLQSVAPRSHGALYLDLDLHRGLGALVPKGNN